MTYTYWFEITDENSDNCGEEFFVEVSDYEMDTLAIAREIAVEIFGDVEMKCHGRVSSFQAEMMGLDTY